MATSPLASAEACDANAALIMNGDLRALQEPIYLPNLYMKGGRFLLALL
jgi:hypothetical protein